MRRILLAALLGLAACEQTPVEAPPPGYIAPTGDVVVTVNDSKITSDMVEAITRRIPPDQVEQMKASGRWEEFIDRIVTGQLLYEEAIARKLHEDPMVQKSLAMSQREILAAELIDKVGEESVTDEAIKAAYEERRVQFARPQVKARHILVQDQALAQELVTQLNAGADFAALAMQHSADPGSKEQGGDLGWFEQGRMIRPVSDAAFATTGNEIVGPIESRVGFHILQVTERREATPMEEVRDQLADAVRQEAIEAYIKKVKDEAKIVKPGEEAPAAETPSGDAPAGEAVPVPPAAGH